MSPENQPTYAAVAATPVQRPPRTATKPTAPTKSVKADPDSLIEARSPLFDLAFPTLPEALIPLQPDAVYLPITQNGRLVIVDSEMTPSFQALKPTSVLDDGMLHRLTHFYFAEQSADLLQAVSSAEKKHKFVLNIPVSGPGRLVSDGSDLVHKHGCIFIAPTMRPNGKGHGAPAIKRAHSAPCWFAKILASMASHVEAFSIKLGGVDGGVLLYPREDDFQRVRDACTDERLTVSVKATPAPNKCIILLSAPPLQGDNLDVERLHAANVIHEQLRARCSVVMSGATSWHGKATSVTEAYTAKPIDKPITYAVTLSRGRVLQGIAASPQTVRALLAAAQKDTTAKPQPILRPTTPAKPISVDATPPASPASPTRAASQRAVQPIETRARESTPPQQKAMRDDEPLASAPPSAKRVPGTAIAAPATAAQQPPVDLVQPQPAQPISVPNTPPPASTPPDVLQKVPALAVTGKRLLQERWPIAECIAGRLLGRLKASKAIGIANEMAGKQAPNTFIRVLLDIATPDVLPDLDQLRSLMRPDTVALLDKKLQAREGQGHAGQVAPRMAVD